jgi:sensor histidine kinase YesM
MNWHDFLFSDRPRLRYTRHAIFWTAWWFYFAGTYFYEQQGFDQAGSAKWIFIILFKSFFLLLGHAFMVYMVIYFLLPRFAFKNLYFFFTAGILITVAIILAWAYFCYDLLFPSFDTWLNLPSGITKNILLWSSIAAGLISALKVVAAATAIKLLKRWYLKQKENERLEKEKINVEFKLLKAQIHPDFLFSSLDNIYLFTLKDSARASELLLKLSDLLSYMLYECDQPAVLLERELKMVKDYMGLEKTRMGNRLEMDMSVKGDTSGKMIAPLLLLPFIKNSFLYCDNIKLEKTWINLDLRIEHDDLTLKLINGKPPDKMVPDLLHENGLANVQKRLDILYPGASEIRILEEPEMMMTFLKLKLNNTEEQNLESLPEEEIHAER